MKTGTLEVTTPTDTGIVMTRSFDASRDLVFDAFTKPELVQRWLLGPPGMTMPLCKIDLTVGGAYRYIWRKSNGSEMEMGGVFREIVRPERIVHTEVFEPDDMGGESLVTTVFVEERGKTTITMTLEYSSREIRDMVIATGMATGVEASYDRLDELLTTVG